MIKDREREQPTIDLKDFEPGCHSCQNFRRPRMGMGQTCPATNSTCQLLTFHCSGAGKLSLARACSACGRRVPATQREGKRVKNHLKGHLRSALRRRLLARALGSLSLSKGLQVALEGHSSCHVPRRLLASQIPAPSETSLARLLQHSQRSTATAPLARESALVVPVCL